MSQLLLGPHRHSLPIINIPHLSGTLITSEETTMTHHNHPKSRVDIRVHPQCCTFCGFGQMYSDIYPSL